MTRIEPEPATHASDDAPLEARELLWPTARFVLGLAIMLLCVGTLAHLARPQCEGIARGFVAAYGYWGMALGTMLADGFHFPIPPQFYMLLSIASGASALGSLLAIVLSSIVAGLTGYGLARFVSQNRWVAARTESSRRLLARALQRFGLRAAVVASILPIPYSVLCYLAGLSRLPAVFLLLVCVCRVPKLILFYYLVGWGWSIA